MKADRIGESALSEEGLAGLAAELKRMCTLAAERLEGEGSSIAEAGLASPEEINGRLVRLIREIELWNPKLGLVEALGRDLMVRHVHDCLAGLPGILAGCHRAGAFKGGALGDVGSGAGLPGLVLAACLPSMEVHLIEKQGRRCAFLLNAKSLMGLSKVTVHQVNLADFPASSLDVLTARAFAPLEPGIMEAMTATLRDEGRLVLYKGRAEKIEAELDACGLDKDAEGLRVEGLAVPGLDEERHLLEISARAWRSISRDSSCR